MARLNLYIDAQNVYQGARRAYFPDTFSHVDGQIDPMKLAELLCSRDPDGLKLDLNQVRVYTGRPDSTRQPKAYSAHMKQCARWQRDGALVIPRTLRYPRNWPDVRAEEKGIDVALAIDFVMGAVDGLYDVGVLFSADTDLRPALEVVKYRYAKEGPVPRVAAWLGDDGRTSQLRVPGYRVWCYLLTRDDYAAIRDTTDYTL